MLQTIRDELGTDFEVFVVDLATLPKLPITWRTAEEEPYAKALDNAIRDKVITKPGKYGIHLGTPVDSTVIISYTIFIIKE